jgi:hypothetical protein
MTSTGTDRLVLPLNRSEILKLIRVNTFSITSFSFNVINKLSFKIFGYTKVGMITLKNNNQLPLYLFKCSKHGLQVSAPVGWESKLICGECLKEIKH